MSKYTLHVLFGQRRCSYDGQYAPEALEVMDEFAWEENVEFLTDKLEEFRKTNEFTALRILEVALPFEEIEKALNRAPEIQGEVHN